MPSTTYRQGLILALICYLIWGLFPIYWLPINQSAIPATQVLMHRIIWSTLVIVLALTLLRRWRPLLAAFRQPRLLGAMLATALFIGINWLVYLWAIMHHHVLDAGLGYFINPLVNMLFARMIFGETLDRYQACAVILAGIGVAWLVFLLGKLPWVALVLAVSFSFYGVLHKRIQIDALTGMAMETLILLPFALAHMLWCITQNTLFFTELSSLQRTILVGSGIMTVVPLLCFSASAKRIPLLQLGIFQYLSPTLQMIAGIWVFHEALNSQRLMAFMWVWAGVAVFVWGMWQRHKSSQEQ